MIDIPHLGVKVLVCTSRKQYKESCKYHDLEMQDFCRDGKHALVHSYNNGVFVICMSGFKKRNPLEIIGLLVHEVIHIWQYILEDIGEDKASKELEAYHIQWLTQNVIAEFELKSGVKVTS